MDTDARHWSSRERLAPSQQLVKLVMAVVGLEAQV